MRRILLPTALAFSLLVAPTAAQAGRLEEPMQQDTHGIAIVADLLLARPLGLVATLTGATLYLVAFPFAAMSGDMTTPAETLVADPARYTFTRPLGQVGSLF